MKAFCYGREIAAVCDYVEDLVIFHCDGEPCNFIGRLEDVEIVEE